MVSTVWTKVYEVGNAVTQYLYSEVYNEMIMMLQLHTINGKKIRSCPKVLNKAKI